MLDRRRQNNMLDFDIFRVKINWEQRLVKMVLF